MRTKYCPHCGSENIERIEEKYNFIFHQYYTGEEVIELLKQDIHYHECLDCQETWEHHDANNSNR